MTMGVLRFVSGRQHNTHWRKVRSKGERTFVDQPCRRTLTRSRLCVGAALRSEAGRKRPGSFRHPHNESGHSARLT
jgi:hypothetical protein